MFMLKKLFLLNFIAAVLILAGAAAFRATTVERVTIEDLAKKARSIVQGKVRGARTYWSANGKVILTTYTIDVEEAIKGQPGRTVELTTLGGQIGDVTLYVAGMPAFHSGERAIVFVEQSGSYSVVSGLSQGKFTISDTEIANQVEGLTFPDGQQPRALRMPLEDFKKQLRAIVGRPQ